MTTGLNDIHIKCSCCGHDAFFEAVRFQSKVDRGEIFICSRCESKNRFFINRNGESL